MPTAPHGPAYLTLGWRVSQTGDPDYWLDHTARPGDQTDDDLAKIEAARMASHSVIIAQSGSGKSAFLGRIIEEILLNTLANCLILDPNADFNKVHEVADASLWTNANFNRRSGKGKLPTERTRSDFLTRWSPIGKEIMTQRRTQYRSFPYKKLELWWPALTIQFLAEELTPLQRSELYHCHTFVRTVSSLLDARNLILGKQDSWLDTAESLLRSSLRDSVNVRSGATSESFRAALSERLDVAEVQSKPPSIEAYQTSAIAVQEVIPRLTGRDEAYFRDLWRSNIERAVDRAIAAASYVSDQIAHFYFARAREFRARQILADRREAPTTSRARLRVLDLPSLPDADTRLIAIESVLDAEWRRARRDWEDALGAPLEEDKRVPTFIIVDEAHNIVRSDPVGQAEIAIRDRFRTLAAEGRKFGLFLILVTQRPDKLDPLVVSECENKALMRLDSSSVLELTTRLLGLEDVSPRLLERCLQLGMGRALMVGRWAVDGPGFIYCAARRTVEGGRNLRDEYWASAT
jgi:Helicase HerA, central domain